MSENTLKFDLIIIGGGPPGVVGATTAGPMGKKVVGGVPRLTRPAQEVEKLSAL